jgi:general secretion pathway protein F
VIFDAAQRGLPRCEVRRAWLRLPLMGRLARGYNAARFAGTLAMLAGAGVPILKALQAAAETWATARCAPTRWPRWCRCARVRRWPARWRQEALPGPAGDVRAAGRADRPAAGDAGPRSRQLSTEVQRRAMAMATILEPLLIVAMGWW